jgi:hypothetical protein
VQLRAARKEQPIGCDQSLSNRFAALSDDSLSVVLDLDGICRPLEPMRHARPRS